MSSKQTVFLVVFKKEKNFLEAVKEIENLNVEIKTPLKFIKCAILNEIDDSKLKQIEDLECVLECQKHFIEAKPT